MLQYNTSRFMVKGILIIMMLSNAFADSYVNMEDTDFDVEVPLLFDQGYECSQNQEFEVRCNDDVGVESLDYEPIYNVVKLKSEKLKKRQYSRKFYGYYALSLVYLNSVNRMHIVFSSSHIQCVNQRVEYSNGLYTLSVTKWISSGCADIRDLHLRNGRLRL